MPRKKSVDTASIGANGALGGNSKQQLKSYVERVQRLESDKAEIASDIRDVYKEAKGNGFDTKTIRWAIGELKLSPQERSERDMTRDTYMSAMGDLAGTPLEMAQRPREFSDADAPRTAMGS